MVSQLRTSQKSLKHYNSVVPRDLRGLLIGPPLCREAYLSDSRCKLFQSGPLVGGRQDRLPPAVQDTDTSRHHETPSECLHHSSRYHIIKCPTRDLIERPKNSTFLKNDRICTVDWNWSGAHFCTNDFFFVWFLVFEIWSILYFFIQNLADISRKKIGVGFHPPGLHP